MNDVKVDPPVDSGGRKEFEPPTLRRFGDLRQLTQGFAGMGGDATPSVMMTRP